MILKGKERGDKTMNNPRSPTKVGNQNLITLKKGDLK